MSVLNHFFVQLPKYKVLASDPFGRLHTASLSQWRCDHLVATSIAQLVWHRKHRLDSRHEVKSLHRLLALYRRHECKDPRDHIYALYTMVGEHRSNLKVDYTQGVFDLFISIIQFMIDHDDVPARQWVTTAFLVLDLLRMRVDDEINRIPEAAPLLDNMRLPICLEAYAELRQVEESKKSQTLRLKLPSIVPVCGWTLSEGSEHYDLKSGQWMSSDVSKCTHEPMEGVGPQDLVHFRAGETMILGFATCRVRAEDLLWQIHGSNLGLIIRPIPDDTIQVENNQLETRPEQAKRKVAFFGSAFICPSGPSTQPVDLPILVNLSLTLQETLRLGRRANELFKFGDDSLDLGGPKATYP